MRLTEDRLEAWGRRIGGELRAGVQSGLGGEFREGARGVVGAGGPGGRVGRASGEFREGARWGVGTAGGAFVGLRGPLGAGKSVLARAVARGAGVEGPMPSPTFNILFRYPLPGGGSVVHADLYRVRSVEELALLGWDDVLADRSIALVEWPERAAGELPDDRWEIELAISSEAGVRAAVARRHGTPLDLPACLAAE